LGGIGRVETVNILIVLENVIFTEHKYISSSESGYGSVKQGREMSIGDGKRKPRRRVGAKDERWKNQYIPRGLIYSFSEAKAKRRETSGMKRQGG